MSILVRDATEADVPAIRDIYNYEIANGWATFDLQPKSLAEQIQWFRETTPPHFIIVAEEDGGVVAWGCLRPFRAKEAYRFTAEDSVYVHHQQRGRGIGRLILARLVEGGRQNGFHSIIAGISQDNPASDRLHAAFGFRLVGVEREVGYKFGRWLDVAWWQLIL